MAVPIYAAAFDRPGGETCGTPKARPVDLAHLSRQTMGDRALEQEVLALFVQQATAVRELMAGAPINERLRLAHGLKGSARGVGAFIVGECATAIENAPADRDAVKRLEHAIDDVRNFVAAISR